MNTINHFSENLKTVAEYIFKNLERINLTANGINYSANDYGFSAYIYPDNGSIIRVSDHHLTGNRVFSTICLDSIESAERWIEKKEKIVHPERFIITEHGYQWYKGEKIMVKSYVRK